MGTSASGARKGRKAKRDAPERADWVVPVRRIEAVDIDHAKDVRWRAREPAHRVLRKADTLRFRAAQLGDTVP